jgi:hypothetical protein
MLLLRSAFGVGVSEITPTRVTLRQLRGEKLEVLLESPSPCQGALAEPAERANESARCVGQKGSRERVIIQRPLSRLKNFLIARQARYMRTLSAAQRRISPCRGERSRMMLALRAP